MPKILVQGSNESKIRRRLRFGDELGARIEVVVDRLESYVGELGDVGEVKLATSALGKQYFGALDDVTPRSTDSLTHRHSLLPLQPGISLRRAVLGSPHAT